MARKPRIHLPGGFYHVILRGNNRQNIFLSDNDRLFWESLIAKGVEKYDHRIHAYCWMTNHVHLAVQAGSRPLGNFVSFFASNYARRFNIRHNKSGHLFERRHREILVQQDRHLMELVRYIHFNPVRANMVERPSQYRWSSHRGYLAKQGVPWLTRDQVLQYFGHTAGAARSRYRAFMRDAQPDFLTLAFRNGSNSDCRVLGEDEWLARVLNQEPLDIQKESLDSLITRYCQERAITEADLRSRSNTRVLARIRAEIARDAVEKRIATISEVAKRFNRSQPSLSRSVSRLLQSA
jgi:REP element-mobilizing transposase RayT